MAKFETRGRELLEGQRAERGLTQKRLADLIGVSQPQVSDWLAGESRPSAAVRERIKRALDIDTAAWLLPDELAPLTAADSAPPPSSEVSDAPAGGA